MAENDTKSKQITAKMALALSALLSGKTTDQAAAVAGVKPRTIYRWQAEPAFRAALDQAAQDMAKDAARALSAGLAQAVNELLKQLADPKLTAADRRHAANSILARWPGIHDSIVITEKIERLEEIIK
jgi:transposase